MIMNDKNLIAGQWVPGDQTFASDAGDFHDGTPDMVAKACEAAEDAFWTYGASSAENRAAFLNAIADEIENRAEDITEVGSLETGLPAARLEGERGRTTGQLRLFASHILKDDYPETRHDPALPDRAPLPRPDLTLIHKPIGPVAIFGASNFPLAFSVAGGDTAAALAAGCPVVVKAHPAHPGTCAIIAEAILAAITSTGQPAGTFSMIHGSGAEVGSALVQHPLIQAVGFTGSHKVGRILFDLCAARPVPIPFFGELGAVNPIFVLPNALANRGETIAEGWAASLTLGAGQFCTNPGVLFVPGGAAGDAFVASAKAALEQIAPQTMLTQGIAQACRAGVAATSDVPGVQTHLSPQSQQRDGVASLLETDLQTWIANPILAEEVFGPHGIIVRTGTDTDMVAAAHALQGQLTVTLQMDEGDAALAKQLLPIAERKAGRVLANGFPTGVEVADAMVHGGPYPASSNFGATSVGALAIRRFLRPVCYQNMQHLL
ncbi:Alpha-ketoglutaric semialdehyde dehydrogenase [Pelagimonas phthalicica]|uniref:Alpha-ketoglutaric semialdehyde dehydrogenase n=1 Tax=Pelagimonas phthalicica TaxID=1037362 RepID=A0A238JH10_9RHOB|nr:aldehyde dehydrogenase (NADP(+)) [Pelagimonas phthalicica]TDS92171.1 2,5-dioxopentanoate dehydrogenase (NAD+) [Pelagimonas phthalicica]SMX29232.1 Alpha-ketoglutaric semialdehyde dehydrogenase [Pelagimonas phthalicica]